ncbi:hypothetical protein VTO42DRAFT_3656 [Malbranchea cinnamomea]
MAFFNAAKGFGPPSTPSKFHEFNSSHATTTPIGAPPSSAASYTPQGPPPSSVLGSSFLTHGSHRKSKLSFSESAFDQSVASEASQSEFAFSTTSSNFPLSPIRNQSSPNFQRSERSLGSSVDSRKNATPPKFGARPAAFVHGTPQKGAQFDFQPDTRPFTLNSPPQESYGSPYPASMLPHPQNLIHKPLIYTNPNTAKRAKLDESWVNSALQETISQESQAPSKEKGYAFSSIARDLESRANVKLANEPSAFILEAEDIICRMYDQAREPDFDQNDFALKLSDYSDELVELWKRYSRELTATESFSMSGGIGPGESAPNVVKACFVGSLILQLHHPPLMSRTASNGTFSSGFRAPFRGVVQTDQPKSKSPVPKVIFDWINFFHSRQRGRVDALRETQPNPTSSTVFWDIVLESVLKAEFPQAVQLLEAADFSHARSALEDGYEQPGYHGAQLQNIQRCINKAVQLLRSSPIMQHGDWDLKGLEWAMYRKRVCAALSELEDFAEGGEPAPTEDRRLFDAPHFGIPSVGSASFSFSQSARMSESKVPWTIYQSLRALYNILKGDAATILKHSHDWVEATVGLVGWWDGEDDNDIILKNGNSGYSAKRQPSQAPRSVDSNPEEAYLRRLDYAFGCVTNTLGKDGFQVNSMNDVEVALASVFEGNVDGVLRILRIWSIPVASFVAEVASFGGWLETSAGSEPLPGFNESDLEVLNYGQMDRIRKDDLLLDYASSVFNFSRLETSSEVRDGWELSLEVLSRLDDQELMKTKVNEYLDRIDLDTAEKMDKMVLLCTELGFNDEACKVSERYGDKVAESAEDYGTALVCYARAHSAQKIKNIIDLLISFCLIQSRAYPARSKLDEQLRTLLYDPKTSLTAVASVDAEGAAMLQFYFSGYAALRSYYDTRDEEAYLEKDQQLKRGPLARKKAAAESLVAVIESAADSIYGGLYDPERKSAVQVDGLLVLFGEVLALAEPDPNRFFTRDQLLAILAAIEDLQTVTRRVYDQCEECLQSALFHYSRSKDAQSSPTHPAPALPVSPRNLLKKSVSSMTGLSGFSLIGSEMLESQSRSHDSIGDSGVLVSRPEDESSEQDVRRGWDWREKVAEKAKGEDILRVLRLTIAKGLSLSALGWS